jgi:hypothetical protein
MDISRVSKATRNIWKIQWQCLGGERLEIEQLQTPKENRNNEVVRRLK